VFGLFEDEGPHVRERGERGAVLQHDRAAELAGARFRGTRSARDRDQPPLSGPVGMLV
jgi:hypothetical protein